MNPIHATDINAVRANFRIVIKHAESGMSNPRYFTKYLRNEWPNDNSNYAVAIRYRDAILFYDAAVVEANRLKQNPVDIIEKELQIWKNWYDNEIYNVYLECFNNKLRDFETIGFAKYVFGKANIQDAITNLLKVATEKYNYTPNIDAIVTNIEDLHHTDYKVFLQKA